MKIKNLHLLYFFLQKGPFPFRVLCETPKLFKRNFLEKIFNFTQGGYGIIGGEKPASVAAIELKFEEANG